MLGPRLLLPTERAKEEIATLVSNCDNTHSLLFPLLALIGFRLIVACRLNWRGHHGHTLCAHEKPALRDQIHGALDRDADRPGTLIKVTVSAQNLLLLQPNLVQLIALVRFQLRSREILLQILFVIRALRIRLIFWRKVSRILRSIGNQ